MAKYHKYTTEQDEFIKDNYTSVPECLRKFNERFGTDLSYSSLKTHANRKLKITTGFRPWTLEMDNTIEKLLWDHSYKEATLIFNEQYGTNFTYLQVQNHCVKTGIGRNFFQKLEEVDAVIEEHVEEKNYQEIKEIINEQFGMNYKSDVTICRRANNLGFTRPHRVWQTTDKRYINGELVTYSEYIRFIGHRFHRLEKRLHPIAKQIVKLQYEASKR